MRQPFFRLQPISRRTLRGSICRPVQHNHHHHHHHQHPLIAMDLDSSSNMSVRASLAMLSVSAHSNSNSSGAPCPLQTILLSRLADLRSSGSGVEGAGSSMSISACHTTAFSVLDSCVEVCPSEAEATLFSGTSLATTRLIYGYVKHSVHTMPTVSTHATDSSSSSCSSISSTSWVNDEEKQLHLHLELLRMMLFASTTVDGLPELQRFRELLDLGWTISSSSSFPPRVLSSLLAIPAPTRLLSCLVVHAVTLNGGVVDARLFTLLVPALLRNDNFYCSTATFREMDAILGERILPFLSHDFDYVSVRWTQLINKLARVYARQHAGALLHDRFTLLTLRVRGAVVKVPTDFYVRLLGALMDEFCSSNEHEQCVEVDKDDVADRKDADSYDCAVGWRRIRAVATQAVRVCGSNAKDLRVLWAVLRKAAMTLPPRSEDFRRLLEAYHLVYVCSGGRAIDCDRGGFHQLVRLTSAGVHRQQTATEVEEVIKVFIVFLEEQPRASFLWILDAVGVVLGDLWDAHGVHGRPQAQQLHDALQRLLVARQVTGVTLATNRVLARVLHLYGIGKATQFWWTCGCGTEMPATAKRCEACLRGTVGASGGSGGGGGSSWTCSVCGLKHMSPCQQQYCQCGCANPRLAAAAAHHCALCPRCSTLLESDGTCLCCEERRLGAPPARSTATTTIMEAHSATTAGSDGNNSMMTRGNIRCAHCHHEYTSRSLFCPRCFHPRDAALSLWHCASCTHYTYSTWSACRRCKAPRRTGALTMPFIGWRCGCGTLCHPRRRWCSACSSHVESDGEFAMKKKGHQPPPSPSQRSHHYVYQCRTCRREVPLDVLRVDAIHIPTVGELNVHQCPHCSALHPTDQLMLYAPALPRHCLRCGLAVSATDLSQDGSFHHCGHQQRLNENYPFQCAAGCCDGLLQTGYHCAQCGLPRAELLLLLSPQCGGNDIDNDSSSDPSYFVWRCLHEDENSDALFCGAWNYSWCTQCRRCSSGRPRVELECRAVALPWQCDRCTHSNTALDVLWCAQCGEGVQPAPPCNFCGTLHRTVSCHLSA